MQRSAFQTRWRQRLSAWALLMAGCGLVAAEPLKVCVSEDSPPQSRVRKGKASGLDVRLAEAVAAALGRPLTIVPFETEFEKESTLTQEVNALLSAGVCDLVSGFPLLQSDLGPASRPSARTPDYPGAKRKRERPFVPLGELVASKAYQAATLGVVLRAGQPPVSGLMDLQGRKVGAVTGTLAGTLVSLYRNGALRGGMVSLSQRESAWSALESGRIDALILPTEAFDAHRLQAPASDLTLATFQRPIGVNLGFVTLATAPADLLQGTNKVLSQVMADGRLKQWAREEGLSWHPPSLPEVSPGPTLLSLVSD